MGRHRVHAWRQVVVAFWCGAAHLVMCHDTHMATEDAEMLKEAKDYAAKLAAALPKRIQAAALTRRCKLPFKALAIRELLLHRTAALAKAAVALFEKGAVIPAVILTRSIVETLAVLFEFHERLQHFLKEETKDHHALDEFLMRCLMGSRNHRDTNMPTATNILTLIDRVEKTAPGFRSVYDSLCEYAHPNWAGTFGAFGNAVSETTELELGPQTRIPAYSAGLSTLSGSLIAFEHYYQESGALVRQLNDYYERFGIQ